MEAIRHSTNDIPLYGEALDEVWWVGRQWAVTRYGLEKRDGKYFVQKNRLVENLREGWSWIGQIGCKSWADVEDVATAFYVAVAMHGFSLTPENMDTLQKTLLHARRIQEIDRAAMLPQDLAVPSGSEPPPAWD